MFSVCLSVHTRARVPHLHPIILPLVPCPCWGAPHLHPIIISLVKCSFWGTPVPGLGVPQPQAGGTRGCPQPRQKGVPSSQDRMGTTGQDRIGVPLSQDRMGYPPPPGQVMPAVSHWRAVLFDVKFGQKSF